MSCFITTGVTLGCADGLGGIKKIYVGGGAQNASFGTLSYDTDGAITGSTSTSTFYGFDLKRNTSSLTQTLNKSFENGSVFYQQDLLAVLYKYDAEKRDLLKIMAQNDEMYIIAIDQNDTQYALGEVNGLYLSAGVAGSGLALGDRNGFELTFTGQEPVPARVIDGVLGTVFSAATFEN